MSVENQGHKFHLPLTPAVDERLNQLQAVTGFNRTKIINAILTDKDIFQSSTYRNVNTLFVELLRQCCLLRSIATSKETKFNAKERKELRALADFYKKLSTPLDYIILPNLKN